MGSHMKTTVEIPDELLARAKLAAARDKTTVRQLIEDGLRRVLADRAHRGTFRLRKASFRGDGLHPDVAGGDWSRIRERIYEGRGE
jgi:hypothetical protein